MKPFPIPSKLRELEKELEPYRKRWKQWTRSKDSFLDGDEVKAVESYLRSGSYKVSGQELGSSEIMFYIKIKNIVTRLNLLNRLNGL